MLRKEQVHQKYEQARALYMAMVASSDLKDRFNSERNRLISNYWRSVYVRMGDGETDEQIVESVGVDTKQIIDDCSDWTKTESARILGKKPTSVSMSDEEYLVEMGIDPDDSIEKMIEEIRGMVKLD